MSHTVLQLVKAYKGNAKLLNEMAKAHKDNYKTITCYMSGRPDGLNQMENIVDETIYLDLSPSKVKWTRYATLKTLAKLIDEKQIDLVVCQFRRPIPIGILSARISTGKPRVVGILHGIVGGKVGLGRKIANWILFRYLARLVSVSNDGVDDIIRLNWGLNRQKVVAIQNGLNFSSIVAVDKPNRISLYDKDLSERFLFGIVGRLSGGKNHERLLFAVKQVRQQFPDIGLLIIGTGPTEDRLKKLVDEYGLSDNVFFTGFRHDVPSLLKSLNVYIMPSLREGLPLALLEAMAAGLPIITSDRSGMRETMGNCPCGEMVDPENIDSLVHAMTKLLSLPPAALEDMGVAAKDRALKQFSAARMIKEYENLYHAVLSSKEENVLAQPH